MSPTGADRRIPFGRLTILVQAIVAVAFVAYLFASDNVRIPLLSDTYTLKAAFSDASGLDGANHNAVYLAGVRIGEVRSVSIEHGQAVATLRLDGSSRGHIDARATARVVPRSALEDQTVEIEPGGGPPARSGSTIEGAPDAAAVPLDRLLQTLDADTRTQLQILLGSLDTGLRSTATPLGRAVRALAQTGTSARSVATKLAERKRTLTRLVGDLRVVFATLAQRDAILRRALHEGRRVLDVTSARRGELADTTRRLPGMIDALGRALADTRALAAPLTPALRDLRGSAAALPGGLRSLRGTLPQLRGLVTDLGALVDKGTAPAAQLTAALRSLRPAATGLTPAVAGLLPILRQINRNRDGVGLVGDRFSGVFSTNDANGPILRGLGFFEDFDPADFGAPGATGARLATLKAKVVTALLRVCRSNPLACLTRYLVPGLPGAVRSAGSPLGQTAPARSHALRLIRDAPARARRLGIATSRSAAP